jgi:hypothetical protein
MYQLIGKEKISYVSKKTGKPISGYRLYFLEMNDRVEGFKSSNQYVDDSTYYKFFECVPLDAHIELFFNAYGQVVSCSVIN